MFDIRRQFEAVLPDSYNDTCVYCGDKKLCRDHFRPWIKYHEPYWLPACGACNGSLNARDFGTLADRCRFVERNLWRRHRLVFTGKAHRVLDGATGNLKDHMESIVRKAQWACQRIGWMIYMAENTRITLKHLVPESSAAQELQDALDGAWRTAPTFAPSFVWSELTPVGAEGPQNRS